MNQTATYRLEMDSPGEGPLDLIYVSVKDKKRRSFWKGAVAIAMLALSVLFLLIVARPLILRMVNPGLYDRRFTCAANLHSIGHALYIYAQDEADGAFPDRAENWQNRLVDANDCRPQDLVCPQTAPSAISYYYVPGYTTHSNPRQVLVYDNPKNHGGKGGCVLFQDAHAEFLPSPAFENLINSLRLPDGRPWAPHRSPPQHPQ